jgi:UDP-3-O-[3-hydroxymyristoyl] N-acetylglucosamine deacetylase/3-hydroxyacyl-[acyl-carrier-protein] dehydratase
MVVDNAIVKVSGGAVGELPAGDGSSQPFVQAIQEAGVVEQDQKIEPLVIRKPIQVTLDGATLAALPGPADKLEIVYDFQAKEPVGHQTYSFRLGEDDFVTQLAPARTFVFADEARELRGRGLGKHLSTKELLVIAPEGPIDNSFRFADECVRHKVLDLVGDLYLVGRPIRGRIIAFKS